MQAGIPPAGGCAREGCGAPGEYKAPKSREQLHEYQWLCLDHVREFNRGWNYFEGMEEQEAEHFRREAIYGHRPTWKWQENGPTIQEALNEAVRAFFGFDRPSPAQPRDTRARNALETLELTHPAEEEAIRAQYRKLVKRHHPDLNGGDKEAEERFKAVTLAYHYLLEHYSASC